MGTDRQLYRFHKYHLNKASCTQNFLDYVENCLASENKAIKHTYHKITVHDCTENEHELFNQMCSFYDIQFVPCQYTPIGTTSTFYTCSLTLVQKIVKSDFRFPQKVKLFFYCVDIVFNSKSSMDLFNESITIDEIIANVINQRFNEHCELDLSYFCSDPEFTERSILFYSVSLLSIFKILMLRMGRDVKILNLSDNNLVSVPASIMNFFIKGDLIGVNFSNNNILKMSDLVRINCKIEKLWLEGNPLCKDIEASTYVKLVTVKFPRLKELDGIPLNKYGLTLPFWKNYVVKPSLVVKNIIEKFLLLYFTAYDSRPRQKLGAFYDYYCTLSISSEPEVAQKCKHYESNSSNLYDPNKKRYVSFKGADLTTDTLYRLPQTIHDPTTFTVDVLICEEKKILLVVDGIFKEINHYSEDIFRFRRTFHLESKTRKLDTIFKIKAELFTISFASKEQFDTSFQNPIRNLNSLAIIGPSKTEMDHLKMAFQSITKLNIDEVERRLRDNNWDIEKALQLFEEDLKADRVSARKFNLTKETTTANTESDIISSDEDYLD